MRSFLRCLLSHFLGKTIVYNCFIVKFSGLAAIHYCAQRGDLEGITHLMKHHANVNLQDERSGRTALFYAIEAKHGDRKMYYEIAHKLLENGADVNIQTFSKHTVMSLIDSVESHALKVALNKAAEL